MPHTLRRPQERSPEAPAGCAQGCANVREDQVKLVMGIDGRPTGEAFVEIAGPGANLALALGKDRQVMPVCAVPYTLPPSRGPAPARWAGTASSLPVRRMP